MSEADKILFSHPEVGFVNVPNCKDVDMKAWPGSWDGIMFPPVNSSTTCKVLGGAAYAVEHFRFKYLARSGDDSYLRWDYFLEKRSNEYAHEWMMLGNFNDNQNVFDHLWVTFGKGRFPPYATGQGYIMTWDVANYLRVGYLAGKTHVTTAGPEDAAIALILIPLDMNNLHTEDFHDPYKRSCSAETLLVHYVTKAMVSEVTLPCGRSTTSNHTQSLVFSFFHACITPPYLHTTSPLFQWESIDEDGVIYCTHWDQKKPRPLF